MRTDRSLDHFKFSTGRLIDQSVVKRKKRSTFVAACERWPMNKGFLANSFEHLIFPMGAHPAAGILKQNGFR